LFWFAADANCIRQIRSLHPVIAGRTIATPSVTAERHTTASGLGIGKQCLHPVVFLADQVYQEKAAV
jgi:hypothetical protein